MLRKGIPTSKVARNTRQDTVRPTSPKCELLTPKAYLPHRGYRLNLPDSLTYPADKVPLRTTPGTKEALRDMLGLVPRPLSGKQYQFWLYEL